MNWVVAFLKKYIKKLLDTYDISVYRYLKDNPVEHMPRITDLFENSNSVKLYLTEAL